LQRCGYIHINSCVVVVLAFAIGDPILIGTICDTRQLRRFETSNQRKQLAQELPREWVESLEGRLISVVPKIC
jgi:hypothetical protein